MLKIENLSVTFDTDEGLVHAVDDVSFDIRPGEILGMVGESGCGKSVTAMSILRLIPNPPGNITHGQILFNGTDLLTLPLAELRGVRGQSISMIFQEPMTALSPLHRVGNQLIETIRYHRDMSKEDAFALSVEWLKKVGIADAEERMYAYPFQLSGGMRQRVMIGGSLIQNPSLVIADEPTTALDVTIQSQILTLLKDIKQSNMSVLLITHDMGVIWEMCSRVIVMYASEVVEISDRKQIFENPGHPYTEALLASIPTLTKNTDRLSTIPGQVPSALNYPSGCRFADRCPYAFDRCKTEHPAMTTFGDRQIRCHLSKQRCAIPEQGGNT